MNIIVCIKLVPSARNVPMDKDYVMQRDRVVQVMNPADESALEAALRLKGQGTVTVITMGKPSAEEALRNILARGADRAVLISDAAFAGADTYATAKTLAAAINRLKESQGAFDLIFCGRRAIDGETGQVPPELAVMLEIPFVTNVTKINHIQGKAEWKINHVREKLECSRLLEDGTEELVLAAPALISFAEYSYSFRLATLQGLQRARRAEIIAYTREELGLAEEVCGLKGSPTRVRRVAGKHQGVRNVTIERDSGEGAARLSNLIIEVQK